MVTAFRYKRILIGIAEEDFVRDPKSLPAILKRRAALARQHAVDADDIAICATPLGEVHGEKVIEDLSHRLKADAGRARRKKACPITPDEIREIRLGLGLTLEALARRLQTTLRGVQRWEQAEGQPGHRKPRGPALAALLDLKREWERKRPTGDEIPPPIDLFPPGNRRGEAKAKPKKKPPVE